MKCKFRNPSSK